MGLSAQEVPVLEKEILGLNVALLVFSFLVTLVVLLAGTRLDRFSSLVSLWWSGFGAQLKSLLPFGAKLFLFVLGLLFIFPLLTAAAVLLVMVVLMVPQIWLIERVGQIKPSLRKPIAWLFGPSIIAVGVAGVTLAFYFFFVSCATIVGEAKDAVSHLL